MSNLKKIRVQHVDRDAKGVEIKTDVDVITDADCITMDDGDLRSGVKKMIEDRIGEVIDGAPEELDTLKEIATELEKNQSGVSTILNKLKEKIDKSQIVNDDEADSSDTVPSSKALFYGLKGVDDELVNLEQGLSHSIENLEEIFDSFYTEYEKEIEKKVDKVDGKGLSTNDFTDVLKNKLNGIEDGAQKNKVTSVNGMTGDVVIEAGTVDLSGYAKIAEVAKKVDKTEIANFKNCIVLSSDAYSKLSDEEKAKSDTLYFLI